MTQELAKTLTTALVQFIDRERPEGTMDCSSAECKSIEEMFEGDQFDIIEAFIQKKLSRMTEFELFLFNAVLDNNFVGAKGNENALEMTKKIAPELLALAKKELARRDEVITLNNIAPYDKGFQDGKAEAIVDLEKTFECNPDKLPKWLKDKIESLNFKALIKGYNKGYKDAEKQYNESVAYHFPTMPTTPVFGCDGIHCTNPQMDCINCPRRTTGGGFSTSSGTSTLKAEEEK